MTQKAVKVYLEKEKNRVDRYLGLILPEKDKNPADLISSLHYAVFSGGKRVRPVLLLHTYRLCGGKGNKALPAAAALELIHTFSLIQDDLPSMDNDDFRRGRPAVHRAYKEYTALLASDQLLILAFELLAKNYPAGIFLEVSRGIGLEGLVIGQQLDMAYQGKTPPADVLEEIRLKKTAALFRLCFKLAAMIAGKPKPEVRLFAEYGVNFGLAFQIRDDIADNEKVETVSRMSARVKSLAGRLEALEKKLRLSSAVLDYFRAFLDEKPH